MRRAALGKRERAPVARFLAHAERELSELGEELAAMRYAPRPYTQFRIRDPKPRTITCADFRDRVVHHALCDICGPVIERRFIADSFACRSGKGAHRAVVRAQEFSRRHPYFLKTDVQAYYDSVDIDTAIGLMERVFREEPVRQLWQTILQHPFPNQARRKGLPIGNLTSQWTANLYLDGLDHRIREDWRLPGYVRYMDDFVAWADDKDTLWWLRDSVADWLKEERGLLLKASATHVAPTGEGLPFLGMRVFPGMLRLQHGRLARMRRLLRQREREYLSGAIRGEGLTASVRAMTGIHAFWGLKGLAVSRVDV